MQRPAAAGSASRHPDQTPSPEPPSPETRLRLPTKKMIHAEASLKGFTEYTEMYAGYWYEAYGRIPKSSKICLREFTIVCVLSTIDATY